MEPDPKNWDQPLAQSPKNRRFRSLRHAIARPSRFEAPPGWLKVEPLGLDKDFETLAEKRISLVERAASLRQRERRCN
jgi:hypothetical protein